MPGSEFRGPFGVGELGRREASGSGPRQSGRRKMRGQVRRACGGGAVTHLVPKMLGCQVRCSPSTLASGFHRFSPVNLLSLVREVVRDGGSLDLELAVFLQRAPLSLGCPYS